MEDAVKERADQSSRHGSNAKDFHSELMMLRKRWRLKRTGTSITGDLTYRSGKKRFLGSSMRHLSEGGAYISSGVVLIYKVSICELHTQINA